MRQGVSRAAKKEERAMNEVSVWITQYQQPLLLACYSLLALTLLLKCGERKGRLPHLIFFLILFVMAAVIFLAKDDPAIWIPAAIALLTVARQQP
jgi:4-amino-4-deoxy-L-arabinose transferase-like glycosyltransferase